MKRPLSRLMASRGVRKFFRNRWAVLALSVIALYVAAGIFVLLGDIFPGRAGISLVQVEQPVAPVSLPGWFGTPTPERRAEAARISYTEVERALRQGEGLADIRFGWRRPAEKPEEELREIVRRAKRIYQDLSGVDSLDSSPESAPKVAELEAAAEELFAPLSGSDAMKQRIAMSLGTDRQGRSILLRAVYSIKVALQVGIVVAVVSVIIGTFLGAMAAFMGGWVDHAVVWLYSTLSSMPELVLLAVLVYAFSGSMFDRASSPWLALVPVYAAMCMEFWIGPCRVIRGETLKLKEMEYVQAATAIGFSRLHVLTRHVIPNTVHLMFINFSLLFIAAIKFEVVLSFLGLGVKVGPSWGRMIQESSQEVVNGFFWQIGAATFFMFFLVLAFNIVSDALQDAFDPKHVG